MGDQPNDLQISAVIPAAGRSSRMGAFKPLLPFADRTLIERVIGALAPVCSEIIVVTGYHSEDLSNYLRRDRGQSWLSRLKLVHNPRWEEGMLTSIQAGAREVNGDYFFVTPSDMPYISTHTYEMLASQPPRYALFPTQSEQPGHPVLISSAVIGDLLEADPADGGGMKAFLSRYELEHYEVDTDEIFRDIDTIEEYGAARAGHDARAGNKKSGEPGRN